MSKPEQDKALIGEYGSEVHGVPAFITVLGLILISLAMGLLIGIFVQAMLWLMNTGIDFVWEVLPRNADAWWIALVICPLGGLVIGLINTRFHAAPPPLEEVMADVKREGTYRVKNVPAGILSFLLPLAFGAPIGPEAGLTGFIAALATRMSAALRRVGLRVKSLADVTVSATVCAVFGAPFGGFVAAAESMPKDEPDQSQFTYRRAVKIVLYGLAAASAFVGVWLVTLVLGSTGGLPHFESVDIQLQDAVWILACMAAGYVLALVFALANKGAHAFAQLLKGHDIWMGLIAGVLLGVLGTLLPMVLFSGEQQSSEIAGIWQGIPALVLVATAVVKVVMTPVCINLGWRGGEIFPCIFAGVALGFGIAAITGVDGVFCATCTCSAFVGAKMRKPVFAAAILLMCFPFKSIIWLIIAACVGFIPQPKWLKVERDADV